MANPFLGQILGSVLGQAMGRGGMGGMPGRGGMGGMGGMGGTGLPGGLGGLLGGALGGGGLRGGYGRGGGLGGNRMALLAMMLPLVMRWVQRSGGVGNVMQRVQQQGYGRHASSWIGTGENEPIGREAVQDLVDRQEIAQLSQQLGVGEDEVEEGFAEILPEMVNHLSPDGHLPDNADHVLDAGQASLDQLLAQAEPERSSS